MFDTESAGELQFVSTNIPIGGLLSNCWVMSNIQYYYPFTVTPCDYRPRLSRCVGSRKGDFQHDWLFF